MLTVNNLVGLGTSSIAAGSLLLDSIAAVPLGAWSFRKLRTDYAGAAVRIRGDDDVEDDFGFAGDDFDTTGAANFITAHGTNGRLAKIYDQMNSNDLAQTVEGDMPGYVTTLNSLPAGDFSTRHMFTGNITLSVKKLSVFGVGSIGLGGDSRLFLWWPNLAQATWGHLDNVLIQRWMPSVMEGYYNASSRGTVAQSQSSDLRMAAIWDGTNATMFAGGTGGTPVAADISAIGNPGPFYIGGDPGSPWVGEIGEVLFFDEPPSGGDITTINADQLAYWGF